MIDRITITVDHEGYWNLNAGDVLHMRTTSAYEILDEVRARLKLLAFFPPVSPLQIDPIPFDKLPHPISQAKAREQVKEKKAREKAEKHLDSLNAQVDKPSVSAAEGHQH